MWLYYLMIPFYALVVLALAPTSYWFEVRGYSVTDGLYEDVRIIFDREIKHNFSGGFTVTVRDESNSVACPVGDFDLTYQEDANLPDHITLDWWIGHDECRGLAPGTYTLTTQWRIDALGFFRKFTPRYSDDFTIYVDGQSPAQLLQQNIELQKRVIELERR